MADVIAVELRVKNKQLANDLKQANAQVARMQKSFVTLGNTGASSLNQISSAANKASKSVSSMATALKVVAAVSAAQVVLGWAKSMSEYVSTIQAANNQLKSITSTVEEFDRVQQAALQVAQETGTVYAENAVTIARLARAMEEFGGTTDQALIVADTLNKAMILTGATGAEATSTLTQFSQALQSGVLAGDELKSLRENAPAVIKAIAEEMKIPISAIKEAGKEGKITADIMTRALIKANADISAQAEQIPLTLDRSFTQVSNAFADFVANNEGVSSLLEGLAVVLVEIGGVLLTVAEDIFGVNQEFADGQEDIDNWGAKMYAAGAIIKGVIQIVYGLGKAIKLTIDLIIDLFVGAGEVVARFGQLLVEIGQGAYTVLKGIITSDFQLIVAGVNQVKGSFTGVLDDMVGSTDKALNAATEDFIQFFEGIDKITSDRPPVPVIKLDPKGTLTSPAAKVKADKTDTKEADRIKKEYEAALQALEQTKASLGTAAEQAIAAYDAIILSIDKYRLAAAAAGVAVNEALISAVESGAVQQVEKALDDLQVAYADLSVFMDENAKKAKEQDDLWKSFVITGLAAHKSMTQITADFKKFNEDTEAGKKAEELKETMLAVKDAFADSVISIIDGSKSAGEAIRGLIKDVLDLIAKLLIMKAIEAAGSAYGINLSAASSGSKSAGYGAPQISVYNYGSAPGGVQARTNSNGNIDIVIGQMTQAINRGGNAFDQALRRTYGLGRVGA